MYMALTVDQFLGLIKGIQEFYRTGNGYPEYPQELSSALAQLDTAMLTSITANVDLSTPFENVMIQLVGAAKANYSPYANIQTNNAEYLLGLLLHHSITVTVGTTIYSTSQIVLHLIENKQNLYGFSSTDLSHPYYRFSMPQWQAQQNYPTLDILYQAWQYFEQQRALASQPQQPQPQPHNPNRNYDNQIWSLSDLSYFIEGFILCGRIRLHDLTDIRIDVPRLPEEVSRLLVTFSQQSRSNHIDAHANLLRFIQALVTKGKYHDPASRLLIGFLFHHQFHLQHVLNFINLNDTLTREFTGQGLFNTYLPQKTYPFLNSTWITTQEYPSKPDLEARVRLAQQMSQSQTQAQANSNGYSAVLTNPYEPPLILRRERSTAVSGPLNPISINTLQNPTQGIGYNFR